MQEAITDITLSTVPSFEELYTALRKKENRIYSDRELMELPNIATTHPHYEEWMIRKESCQKLVAYFKRKGRPIDFLEIGCGNGWLSHKLSAIHFSTVTGIDINSVEIEQAKNVFRHIYNLQFINGAIDAKTLPGKKFDVILFAASIQYFASFAETIRIALKLLNEKGEIHILDSHFYSDSEIPAARERSGVYYEAIGFPEMANYYFHHRLGAVEEFNPEIRYDPKSFRNKLLKNKNPFYWICIRQKKN